MPQSPSDATDTLVTSDKRGATHSPGPNPGLQLIVSNAELEEKVREFRHWLRHQFAQQDVTLIPVLKGGNIFFSDVFRNSGPAFSSLSWAHVTARSGGAAKRLEDVYVDAQYLKREDIDNRHCIVLDDVFDSGYTAEAVLNAIQALGSPASLSFFTVVEKDRPRTCLFRPTQSLFLIDNVWVCGYGLDGGSEQNRQLRMICQVKRG
jgi:hypoxanthine phosphoribosyltransferase